MLNKGYPLRQTNKKNQERNHCGKGSPAVVAKVGVRKFEGLYKDGPVLLLLPYKLLIVQLMLL